MLILVSSRHRAWLRGNPYFEPRRSGDLFPSLAVLSRRLNRGREAVSVPSTSPPALAAGGRRTHLTLHVSRQQQSHRRRGGRGRRSPAHHRDWCSPTEIVEDGVAIDLRVREYGLPLQTLSGYALRRLAATRDLKGDALGDDLAVEHARHRRTGTDGADGAWTPPQLRRGHLPEPDLPEAAAAATGEDDGFDRGRSLIAKVASQQPNNYARAPSSASIRMRRCTWRPAHCDTVRQF